MLYFLDMPTRSIYVGECESINNCESLNGLRNRYEPVFLPRICTVSNINIEKFNREFSYLKIHEHQYKPGDPLIDFINKFHDESSHFRNHPHIPNPLNVRASFPPDHLFKCDVAITEAAQQALLIEGVYSGISGTEIIREWIDLLIKCRKEVHAMRDPSHQIEKINEYALKG